MVKKKQKHQNNVSFVDKHSKVILNNQQTKLRKADKHKLPLAAAFSLRTVHGQQQTSLDDHDSTERRANLTDQDVSILQRPHFSRVFPSTKAHATPSSKLLALLC